MASYGLFIGINHYVDKAFTALSCPEEDANELYSLFKRDLSLGENAHKLLGQASLTQHRRLSTVDVRRVLRDEIGPKIRNGDSFIFFFAGHGYQDPQQQDQYLLFPEADANLIRSGKGDSELLPLSTLVALTDQWEGVQRVFVLDACRSWLPGRSALSETFQNEAGLAYLAGRDAGLRKKASAGDTARAASPVIVNACRDGETAYELENKGRGVLSLALERQILKERDSGQPIWLGNELLGGVKQEMQELLLEAKIGAVQTPILLPGDAKILIFKSMPNNFENLQHGEIKPSLILVEEKLQNLPLENIVVEKKYKEIEESIEKKQRLEKISSMEVISKEKLVSKVVDFDTWNNLLGHFLGILFTIFLMYHLSEWLYIKDWKKLAFFVWVVQLFFDV